MKNRKRTILFIVSLLFYPLLYSAPADTTSIIDNIYNYNFIKASDQLSKLEVKDPLMTETLNLEMQWWMALGSNGEDRFSKFLNTLNEFENSDKNRMNKIISSTYRIRYYACVNKSYLIPFLFLNVKRQIESLDSAKIEKSGKETFELFCMYKSFFTLLQNNLFINKFLQGPDKNRQLIGNIEAVIHNGTSPNKTIGRYFLMKYYLDIEKDKSKAFVFLAELHKEYPENLIFTQLLLN
jgi:hypothetical protein